AFAFRLLGAFERLLFGHDEFPSRSAHRAAPTNCDNGCARLFEVVALTRKSRGADQFLASTCPRLHLRMFGAGCTAGSTPQDRHGLPGTVMTGHSAVATTRAATLPSKNRTNPVRPCVPRMMRSTFLDLAVWTICRAASPERSRSTARAPAFLAFAASATSSCF